MSAWVDVGARAELKFAPGAPVKIGDHWLAVFELGDRLVAIDNNCPHASAPLCDGTVIGGKVVCYLHCWEFDLATGACVGHVADAHDKIANGAAAVAGRFVSVSRDLTLRAFDHDGVQLAVIPSPHTHSIKCIAAHPHRPLVATGAYDGTLALFDDLKRPLCDRLRIVELFGDLFAREVHGGGDAHHALALPERSIQHLLRCTLFAALDFASIRVGFARELAGFFA